MLRFSARNSRIFVCSARRASRAASDRISSPFEGRRAGRLGRVDRTALIDSASRCSCRSIASRRFFSKVPSIQNLRCLRRAQCDASSVLGGSVTSDDFDTGMVLQPSRQRLSPSIRQKIECRVSLEIDDDGAVDLTLTQGEVIHADHAWRWR
jgi:hypothetical protein